MHEGKKAILVVSFGTSYEETRNKTIGAIENDIREAYPDYEVRRAFTSGMILRVLARREGLHIDTVKEAMERLLSDGFSSVYVQPTHILNGTEYDDMVADIKAFEEDFEVLEIGAPLLTDTEDYRRVVKDLMDSLPPLNPKEALVLMGHGTVHHVNAAYAALNYHFNAMGYPNVFVGTVEGYPTIDEVVAQIKTYGSEKVYLFPFMVVAGDHACNDMAGDEEDSWKTVLRQEGYRVECILKGLGEISAIRRIYSDHLTAILPTGA